MRLDDIPLIATVFAAGPDDRPYDLLLLLGPLLVVLIAILGRSAVTEGLAVTYLGVLVTYVLYRGTR